MIKSDEVRREHNISHSHRSLIFLSLLAWYVDTLFLTHLSKVFLHGASRSVGSVVRLTFYSRYRAR